MPNGCTPTCNPSVALSCGPEKVCKPTGNGGGECVVGCVLDEPTSCAAGHVCEPVEGGEPKCFGAVQIQGIVEHAITKAPIGGAHVAARDEGGGVVGNIAVTAADGTYAFTLSAKRKPDGTPVSTLYTLRSDASGFQTFPGALRPALPVDLGKATAPAMPDGTWVLKNATTTIDLFPIANTSQLGTIRGTVKSAKPGGTLVDAKGVTGVADASGAYAIFNVPAGMASVTGYAANVQLSTASTTVPAGGEVKDVDLSPVNKPTATISGNVNIVNAPGGSKTSVVLVVEDTFIPNLEIGEVPKGLRASDVTGAFMIAGVPDGKYVVLASLDNDGLVRDPDTSIGGTQIVKLIVTNGVADTTSFNFKVTEALAVKSPGASSVEEVTATPTFVWADDSSEDEYTLRVFDALGTLVWEKTGLPPVKGSNDVSVPYAGPALKSGTIYQFRAISSKMGVPISRTEELRGVFLVK